MPALPPAGPARGAGRSAAGGEEAARLRGELARKTEEVAVLRRISAEVNSTLDPEAIYGIVLRTMDTLFGFRHALILLLDEAGDRLEVVASRGYPEPAIGVRVPVGVGIIGVVARKRRMMRIGNLGSRRSYMAAVRREMERSQRAGELGDLPRLPGLEGAESQIAIPLLIKDRLVGVLSLESEAPTGFDEHHETLASIVANLSASAIHNALAYRREEERRERAEGAVEERTRELDRTRGELAQVRELRAKERRRLRFDDIAGDSPLVQELRALLRKLARGPASTVLLTGENGTGKDLAAKVLHDNGPRALRPFMNITCSALAESLLESELFGHEPGAFTDAKKLKKGLLELADGGTVFLDEIGEMSLKLQAKLLRFLEEKAFKRVGGAHDVRVDVRVIAATNRDLARMVREGGFREDLYYRLRVLPVELPPLRARAGDVPLLAQRFVRQFQHELGKVVTGIAPDAMARLQAYPWPGNVRELRNAVERAVLLAEGPVLECALFPAAPAPEPAPGPLRLPEAGLEFEELERELVRQALERAGWNKARAARLLGMPRDWLRYRMEKFGLAPDA